MWDLNPGSSALEEDSLTTRPTRWSPGESRNRTQDSRRTPYHVVNEAVIMKRKKKERKKEEKDRDGLVRLDTR